MFKSDHYLAASLLDEVTAVLHVEQQVGFGVVQDADRLIDEQVGKRVLHPEGHVQDVRHLQQREPPDCQAFNT